MNILVVDDEYYIVKSIIDTVDWSGLGIEKTFSAYSAAQAKRVLEKETIDILLSDIEMPQEDGLSLIRYIRERQMKIQCLLLTGHQRFDYAQAAINLHILAYILKPVDIAELETHLAEAVHFHRQLQNDLTETQNPAETVSAEDTADPVVRIKQYIREHLSDSKLNREQIAAYVHMNEDYISHIFSTRTGGSLVNYIQEVRMEEAKRLLIETNLSLAEISEKTGFSTTSYFHRQFKKNCDMTPQSYREQNR